MAFLLIRFFPDIITATPFKQLLVLQVVKTELNALVPNMLNFWFSSDERVFMQAPETEYPVVVRFDSVNYAGIATNNFGIDELTVV